MKVLHLNHSDILGGAARATYRIHNALWRAGLDSWMGVDHRASDDWKVFGPRNRLEKALVRLRPTIGAAATRLLKTGNQILHSPGLLSTSWPKRLKELKPDIVHLHWICNEMLSIQDIGRLSGPIVWTLHDMWAFCGAEHYSCDFRWQDGYMRNNRPHHESGLDLNRWVWERKRKQWERPIQIVTPSKWLAECVRKSMLMRDWPVSIIPNPIDTDVWAPVDQRIARSLLGLPLDVPLVLFGAILGGTQSIKGFDLLLESLRCLGKTRKDLCIVVFGQSAPQKSLSLPFIIHYMGHIHDDITLRILYSAADVMVIPSRKDNLPNTGVEALSCGIPVVAFNTSGLPDIVEHKKTGYLANPFEPEDLAAGVCWVLDASDNLNLARNARNKVLSTFAAHRIAAEYIKLYDKILSDHF
jgi:glycosyltransferase involved in cell wall biosynthesis